MMELARSRAVGPINLGPGPTRVSLSGTLTAAALAQHVGAAAEIYLLITGLHSDAPPGVVFDIYLAPPHEFAPGPASPFLAGTLNFFAANVHPTVSLDVSTTAHALASKGLLGPPLDVVIVPEAAPATGSHAAVATLILVAQ